MTQKIGVVIGGTGHLGKAVTLCLLQAGCGVAIVTRGHQPIDNFNSDASSTPPRVTLHPADVTDEVQVRNCLQEIKATLGHINFLVYSAGFEPDMDLPLSELPKVI